MSLKSNLEVNRFTVKTLFSIVTLISNAFAWYSATYYLITEFVQEINLGTLETIAIWGVNSGAAAASALLISNRAIKLVNREQFLILWMLLGAVTSVVPLIIGSITFFELALIALLWGVSFGVGMPLSMEYYTDNSVLQNRGRVGGMIFLVSSSASFFFGIVGDFGTTTLLWILSIWRIMGLLLFYKLKVQRSDQLEEVRSPSYSSILAERSFILYLIPWIMFSLINYLSVPILGEFFGSDFVGWSSLIEGFIIGVSALIGGFACDVIGRKRLIVFGFVAVGFGYAILSVFPGSVFSWYIYTVLDGVAWGMFAVTFLMTLWGDLAYEKPSRKYYALGGLPFLFANLLQVLIGKDLANSISVFAVFPLTSLFLFLAVLPLIYAPETLPEKQIRDRALKSYVEKAKKVKEKHV